MKIESVITIKEILLKLREYYEKGYFVYDFDALKDNQEPKGMIEISNPIWEKNRSFSINPLFEPKEAVYEGKFYLQTLFYLFGLWSFKYLTGNDYEMSLKDVKYPGLFQFFEKAMVDNYEDRLSDFDEAELYLEIAIDELSYKNYTKKESKRFDIEAITSIGMVRYENQDSFYADIKDENLIAVVADGMGGGSCGDVASKIATNIIKLEFDNLLTIETDDTEDKLKDIILDINKKIINYKNNHNLKSMGTTISVILIKDNTLFFANVGDSRIYVKYRDSEQYTQITQDQSLAEVEYRNGNITKEEKENMAKNVLAYVLGMEDLSRENINSTSDFQDNLKIEDIEDIILCCDGCWDLVECKDFNKDVKEILSIAQDKIMHDNTTIIKIKIKDTYKKQFFTMDTNTKMYLLPYIPKKEDGVEDEK